MDENDISFIIRGVIFKLYNLFGPGLLESVYEALLKYELEKEGLHVATQVALPVYHEGVKIDIGFRMDMVVNGKVIIEIKSVEEIHKIHHKQVLTYLRLSGLKLAILVNFNTDDIEKSIIRKVNGL